VGLIVVAGALANKPFNGGAAWTRLSWVLGFARLGYDVHFVEQIAPGACVNAAGERCPVEASINFHYFRQVTDAFDLRGRATLVPEDGAGPPIARADLLVNISGHLTIEPLKSACRTRAFIDLDPGYTQFWYEAGLARERLRDHHFYFTVGANIGTASCPIPTLDIPWRPVRQPVVLSEWPVASEKSGQRFTTIASWRGPYGRIAHEHGQYGVKAHEFRKFVSLPARARGSFEIALDVDPADHRDVELLRSHAWTVVDPKTVAGDPFAFRRYVNESSAEFSVAQGIYVETNSGWFSDRTVRYLAAGKPVLVQDTGFSSMYPTGYGLVSFNTVEQAVRGADTIVADYSTHSRMARTLAEEFFGSDRVLGTFLDSVGIRVP
jgi:hypothetical protein